MNVELVSCTPDALTLLLRTKGTRLEHQDDPSTWSDEKRAEHLGYMRDTIQSSWEFVDYVFRISGVTRAFTHQLVRTRTGSYAQEAMRAIDARDHEVVEPSAIEALAEMDRMWREGVGVVMQTYGQLLDHGAAPQDARGLLPTNVTTSIMAKFNLRSLHEMAKLRLCTRAQGEYQDVFRAMRREVMRVHPWAERFIDVFCAVHGTCVFPRYGRKECPFFPLTAHDQAMRRAEDVRVAFWSGIRYEASPVAKDGVAV